MPPLFFNSPPTQQWQNNPRQNNSMPPNSRPNRWNDGYGNQWNANQFPQANPYGGQQQMSPMMGFGPNNRQMSQQAPQQQMSPMMGFGSNNRQMPQQTPQQQMPPMMGFGQNNRQMPQQQIPQQQMPPPPQLPTQLPDGVTYQPLDEKTLQELRLGTSSPALDNKSISPETQEKGEPDIKESSSFSLDSHMLSSLERIIQNERNGSIFYQGLAEIAPRAEYKRVLDEISGCCSRRNGALNQLHKKLNGSLFEVSETNIFHASSFSEGIALAIHEESKTLRELTAMFEDVEDVQVGKILSSQIYRKFCDLNDLHMLSGSYSWRLIMD